MLRRMRHQHHPVSVDHGAARTEGARHGVTGILLEAAGSGDPAEAALCVAGGRLEKADPSGSGVVLLALVLYQLLEELIRCVSLGVRQAQQYSGFCSQIRSTHRATSQLIG